MCLSGNDISGVLDSDAYAVHEIVGVLRAIEAVAYIDKESTCEVCLEREGGVDAAHVVASVVHVYAYANANCEYRCANLATQ